MMDLRVSIGRVRAVAVKHADTFRCDLYQWLLDPRNVDVWRRFEREANRAWAKGRKHYSARTIVEFLRHHTLAEDAEAEFKLNVHICPVLARLWTYLYPDRAGFFKLRRCVVGVSD